MGANGIVSHFVTDGSETVGIGRDDSGTSAAEKPDGVTLFGNGRYRLESPSLGSTPGHPKKVANPERRREAPQSQRPRGSGDGMFACSQRKVLLSLLPVAADRKDQRQLDFSAVALSAQCVVRTDRDRPLASVARELGRERGAVGIGNALNDERDADLGADVELLFVGAQRQCERRSIDADLLRWGGLTCREVLDRAAVEHDEVSRAIDL